MVVLVQAEQFRSLRSPHLGLLVGIKVSRHDDDNHDVITHVLLGGCGCVSSPALPSLTPPPPQWVESWERVRPCFPGGCELCGVCMCVEDGREREIVAELMTNTDLPTVAGGNPLVMVLSDVMRVYEVGVALSLEEVEVSGVGDYLTTHTHLLRVTSSLPALADPHDTTQEELLAGLPQSQPVFLMPSLHLLLPPSPKSHSSPHDTFRQLLQQHKTTSDSEEAFLAVELLTVHECTGPLTVSLSSPLSSHAELALPIDTLALVHLDLTLPQVGVVLWEAIQRQLHAVASAMLWKSGCLYDVAIHHFPPSSYHLCPLTIPYPHTSVADPASDPLNDTALLSIRESWHRALGLPLDMPMLRITNAHCFTSHHHDDGSQLISPHTALTYTPQGTVAMVAGKYAYYHYMQDNFNDNGWGCAYRSLQTVWSWFNLQGFTTQAPPTHRQIQEALVAMGDKQAKFVGSREWIGSFEVSTCLNHLLGVESRIHHVSSGEEMRGVGRVLLHHFTNQGTPVMVGGGVLAHTILGVDYNTRSGAIKFLILDPHFTGRDNLKTIINKGWCGWRPVSFWDQKAHYNMCMPQRPRQV